MLLPGHLPQYEDVYGKKGSARALGFRRPSVSIEMVDQGLQVISGRVRSLQFNTDLVHVVIDVVDPSYFSGNVDLLVGIPQEKSDLQEGVYREKCFRQDLDTAEGYVIRNGEADRITGWRAVWIQDLERDMVSFSPSFFFAAFCHCSPRVHKIHSIPPLVKKKQEKGTVLIFWDVDMGCGIGLNEFASRDSFRNIGGEYEKAAVHNYDPFSDVARCSVRLQWC